VVHKKQTHDKQELIYSFLGQWGIINFSCWSHHIVVKGIARWLWISCPL